MRPLYVQRVRNTSRACCAVPLLQEACYRKHEDLSVIQLERQKRGVVEPMPIRIFVFLFGDDHVFQFIMKLVGQVNPIVHFN